MRFAITRIAAGIFLCFSAVAAPMEVHLISSLPSPQPVGASIGFLGRLANAKRSMHVFRFSVSTDNGPFQVVRDFSQSEHFIWTPELLEHSARVRVTARDNQSNETAEADLPFQIVARVVDKKPVVTATANPIVALFSAPGCKAGNQFRVAFQKTGDSTISHTDAQPCRGDASQNTYVAGMRADTDYQLRPEIRSGATVQSMKVESGKWIPFHSGLLDGDFPPVRVSLARSEPSASPEPLILRSVMAPWRPMATDQEGSVVWYSRQPFFITRMLAGGRFLGLGDGTNSANDMRRLQLVQEVDLAGNILRETNISRVAEQLVPQGIHSDCKKGGTECVPGFHHEALRLPNGHTLVLTGLERMLPAGTQGSKEPVDVLGDLVVDLDKNFQVAWVWNAFDYLDLNRVSLSNEKCKIGPGEAGCTPVFLADTANGWLHCNSLNYDPATGDLLVSIPEQDWILKIDYQNGKGTGKVLWKLGKDGDFTVDSKDPSPWFSYQHDVGFEPGAGNLISLLDDGHRRKAKNPAADNRGQIWKIDEQAKTASLIYNADLGVFSMAVGSAQSLPNGNYSFEAGLLNPPAMYSETVETSSTGKVVFTQEVDGAITYRSFRVADMYSAPKK